MLSALVHAILVTREEHKLKLEMAEQTEHIQAQVDAMADVEIAQANERTPLLWTASGRERRIGGGRIR
jgi:hypothetical protein